MYLYYFIHVCARCLSQHGCIRIVGLNLDDAAVLAPTFPAAPSSLLYTVYPHRRHPYLVPSSRLRHTFYLKSTRMSEDARSTKGRKVLYVANPGSGGSDDGSEDYHRRPNGHSYPYKRPHQQVYLASRQPRLTPSQPPILTTDLPLKNSNYQQPQPQLSPDSTGSPAADESTPPPTTPSLHAPSASVDLQPRADNFNKPLPIPDATTSSHCDRASPNETTPRSITSRKGKFLQTLKAPFGSRPPPRTAVDNNSPRRPRTVSPSHYIPLYLKLTFTVSNCTNSRPYHFTFIRYTCVNCLRGQKNYGYRRFRALCYC